MMSEVKRLAQAYTEGGGFLKEKDLDVREEGKQR
jgi:hypothetical protein